MSEVNESTKKKCTLNATFNNKKMGIKVTYLDAILAKDNLTHIVNDNVMKVYYAYKHCYSQLSNELAKDYPDEVQYTNPEWQDKIVKFILEKKESGHTSCLEQGSVTFVITGSRTMSHQLVRTRVGVGIAQNSQRYVPVERDSEIIPESMLKLFSKNSDIESRYNTTMINVYDLYSKLVELDIPKEDARFVLMQGVRTSIQMTFNFAALYRFFEMRLCCYSDDTEVLTTDGWKNFKDVSLEDTFYTLNLDNHHCEFLSPTNVFHYDYNGPMYKTKSQSIDLLVTPNHYNVISSSYDNKKFKLERADENNTHRRVLMKKNCNPISGKRIDTINLWEKNVDIKDFLRFLGFYLSDGYTHKSTYTSKQTGYSHTHYNVGLSKGNMNLMLKYLEIFKKLTNNTIQVLNDKNGFKLEVTDRKMYTYFSQFGKAKDKHIPDFVWELDYSLLKYLYEGFCDGDMTKRDTGKSYTTISYKLANDVQRLCTHLGFSGSVSYLDRSYELHKLPDGRYVPGSKYYTVSINVSKNEPIVKSSKHNAFSIEPYNGQVHCVELPRNHTLLVRRNGYCVWSGNSRAQWEIRNVAKMMASLMKIHYPGLFDNVGPRCKYLGWCPEHKGCGKFPPKKDVTVVSNKLLNELTNLRPDAMIIDEYKKIIDTLQNDKEQLIKQNNEYVETIKKLSFCIATGTPLDYEYRKNPLIKR